MYTGEKPFSCDLCKKLFKLRSQLKKHKIIHTGEKQYSCDHCDKTFCQKNKLTKHKRIHSGIKPFSCKPCDKYYVSRSELLRHNKSPGHLEMMNTNGKCNTVPTAVSIRLIRCEEVYIKEEIKKEDVFDEDPRVNIELQIEDPLSCEHNYNEDRVDTIVQQHGQYNMTSEPRMTNNRVNNFQSKMNRKTIIHFYFINFQGLN